MVEIIARDNKQNHNQIIVSKDNGGPLRTARDGAYLSRQKSDYGSAYCLEQ